MQLTATCTSARAWARLMFRRSRQHRKHTADYRLARCVGCGNAWNCIWAKVSICRCWLESQGYQCIILRDNLSNPPGHAAFLPHAKASRTSPGDVGSDGSLVSGNCVRRGLFRPRSPSASLSPYARYDPSRASVVATLGTNDVLDSHTPLGTKPVHRALSRRMVAMVDTLASHLGNNNAISCLR